MTSGLGWKAGALGLWLCAGAAGPIAQLRETPIPHARGQSVTPSFEGWYPNADGTFSLSFGYFNRNYEQGLDIPVGPLNRMEPLPEDAGQPTHFLPRRHTGVFTVRVPAGFGVTERVTWTLVSGGETISVPGHLRPEWKIDALKEQTSGNSPPVLKLEPAGPSGQGPGGVRRGLTAIAGTPVSLPVWVTDDGIAKMVGGGEGRPALGVVWYKHRGPGAVMFGETDPQLDQQGKATTVARFATPGDYVLRVLAWDSSGRPGPIMASGFQCCWTNGYVDVTVSPASGPARGKSTDETNSSSVRRRTR